MTGAIQKIDEDVVIKSAPDVPSWALRICGRIGALCMNKQIDDFCCRDMKNKKAILMRCGLYHSHLNPFMWAPVNIPALGMHHRFSEPKLPPMMEPSIEDLLAGMDEPPAPPEDRALSA